MISVKSAVEGKTGTEEKKYSVTTGTANCVGWGQANRKNDSENSRGQK